MSRSVRASRYSFSQRMSFRTTKEQQQELKRIAEKLGIKEADFIRLSIEHLLSQPEKVITAIYEEAAS